MTIVVSGASGQLGRRASELVLDSMDPSQVILATRSPEKLADLAERGAQVRRGDFDDEDGLAAAFAGGDRLLLISVDPVSKLARHRRAIDAAKAAGVGFVAYTSIVNPFEDNPATVAREHRETERLLRESGLEWAILRNSLYAEHQLDHAESALAAGTLPYNSGDGRIAYVSRDDCAAAAAAVVGGGDHHGKVYDVTGPESLDALDLASMFAAIGGREVAPVAVDDAALAAGMVEHGVPDDDAELIASFGVAARRGYLDGVSGAVEDLTGRAPRTLREVLQAHRDQIAATADDGDDDSLSRRTFIGSAAALGAAAMVPAVGTIDAARAGRRRAGPHRRDDDREIVLITGASSGFGELTALALARQGYGVYATMRNTRGRNATAARRLERVARAEELALEVVDIDVRSERSVESGVRTVLRRSDRIDVLVNNAGIFYPALLETQTVADVQEVFDTNVFGQLRMNRAVLPAMRERGQGLVVQMTSGVGRIAFPFQGAYNGGKWAMEAMTQVMRYELSQSGVDVVIVEPGAYPTDLIDNARIYYRDYLRSLSKEDARRRRTYGDLAERLRSELEEATEPAPQEVVDAIVRLVRTPPGQRPLRTLVGEQVAPLEEINAVHERVQNEILGYAGYEDMIAVRPGARRRR